MLDNFQALMALSDVGSVTKAANRLHISQSALSKRIQNLEHEVGYDLIEPCGRGVRITSSGRKLLVRARPLIRELNQVMTEELAQGSGVVSVSVNESVLYSWGAKALAAIQERNPHMELSISSLPARIALEKVRSGEVMLSIAPGTNSLSPDLSLTPLFDEPMVLVPSKLKPFKLPKSGKVEVISSEKKDITWLALKASRCDFHRVAKFKFEHVLEVQSFAAVIKMAEAGFGHGLVPLGVAKAFGLTSKQFIRIPKPGITRPIALFGRPTNLARNLVKDFSNSLTEEADKALGSFS